MKNSIDYSIYLVIGKDNVEEGNLLSSIEDAILGGCTLVQLREKDASSLDFFETALQVKKITDKYNIPLIINDRADIAVAIDAAGLHVGQKDLPAKVARKIIGEEKLLGVSASNIEEACAAEKDGADYLGIGAMILTDPKSDAKLVTIEDFIDIRNEIKIPLVIIGGINEETMYMFKDTGVDGLAVVSAILSKPDKRKATADLKERFIELNGKK